MKRILIALLVAAIVVVIALTTRGRLPRAEQAADTVPGAIVAPRDTAARDTSATLRPDSLDADTGDAAGQRPAEDPGAGEPIVPPLMLPEQDADDDAAAAPNGTDGGRSRAPTAVAAGQVLGTNQILERAAAAYANVRSMQADFTMAMTNPLLRRTTNSRGTLFQRRPDRIALRFTEPAGDVIVSDGRYFWIYYPSVDARQVIRMPAGQGAAGGVDLQAQFVGNPNERFHATMHPQESVGGRPTHVLTLEPRGTAGYESLKVWLDANDYLARRFEIVEENGAVRRFDLANVRTNVTLGDDTFRFTPPADARIVDRS